MSGAPVDRLSWRLFSPFRRIDLVAEFTFADKARTNNARIPTVAGRTYTSKRYAAPMDVASIDVSTSDYLVFKHRDFKQDGDGVGKALASYPHLPSMVRGFREALDVFGDGCFKQNDDDTFELTEKGLTVEHSIMDLFADASLLLVPTIFCDDRDDGSEEAVEVGEPGVRMYVNSVNHFGDAKIPEFLAFLDFIERFDLFATSRAAVSVAASAGHVHISTGATAQQPARAPVTGVARPATKSGLGGKPKTLGRK